MSGEAKSVPEPDAGQVEACLRDLVVSGDLRGLRSYADALTKDERRVAKAWAAKRHEFDGWPGPPEILHLDDRAQWARRALFGWGRVLLVGRLESPAAAVKGVRTWGDGIDARKAQRATIAAFTDRGAEWGAAFVTAADSSRIPSDGPGAGMLALLMRHLVLAHDLPVPTSALFHAHWVRLSEQWNAEHDLVDALRVDPLMPQMLHRHLASGECGINRHLPHAVAVLVEEGRLDRGRVGAVVIEQLSATQRVSSMRVLANIAHTLDLRADEVPGGLPYLVGVLSTAHASIAKMVLPLAIDLVGSEGELGDLARTVSGRPEKALRQRLRKELVPKKLGARLPAYALVTALDTLADGEEDVAVRAQIAKARVALGGAPAEETVGDDEPLLGLWDLEPAAAEGRSVYYHDLTPYEHCLDLMSTGTGRIAAVSEVQDRLLDELASGELSALNVLAAAQELLVEERLSPARTANLLEPLLLGGAMRTLWPVALRIADLSAASGRPGMDKLVRMLGRYAAEVPGTSVLPPHLAKLALGKSKAAQEARRLGARLAHVAPESYDPRPAAAAPEVPDWMGLYEEAVVESVPWALGFGPERDLSTVMRRVTSTPRQSDQMGRNGGTVWASVLDSNVLDELVALIHEHGAAAVRETLGTVETHFRSSFVQGVSAWSQGLLTPESYWRLVRDGVPVQDMYEKWIAEFGSNEAASRMRDLDVAEGLRHEPPLLPTWWRDPWRRDTIEQIRFLHTCEALLVAERGGHLVSTPDVSDGSLGLHTLLDRLAKATAVGPLDLRLALGRLRPTEPADAAKIAYEVLTDPALTSPGGQVSRSASDMVREWVGQGGLTLRPQPRVDGQGWEFDTAAPIPWTSFAALEGLDVPDLPRNWGSDDVWVLPGRPDLALRHGFLGANFHYSVAAVGGEIGLVGWDSLLLALGTRPSPSYSQLDVRTLVRLQGQGRLDPAAAARAAVARWDSESPEFIGSALGWTQGFLRGAMGPLWPVALAVVEAGLRRPERPADLVRLVEVLARHVHEVPSPVLPPAFAEVAAEHDNGPLHVALRGLLAHTGGAA